MDIPAVKERDPNPEGGPRLNVKEFRIQGLEDDPDFNISKAELTKRVEAIRFDLMGEGKNQIWIHPKRAGRNGRLSGAD